MIRVNCTTVSKMETKISTNISSDQGKDITIDK